MFLLIVIVVVVPVACCSGSFPSSRYLQTGHGEGGNTDRELDGGWVALFCGANGRFGSECEPIITIRLDSD